MIARIPEKAGYRINYTGGIAKTTLFAWVTTGFGSVVTVDTSLRATLLENGTFGKPPKPFDSSKLGVHNRLIKRLIPQEQYVLVCTISGAIVNRVTDLPQSLANQASQRDQR